ncbi:hypothetical protein EVAR_19802_1 [Eumeta japonica]|uniref:Reverse transcriptase domain-containing protein n=1 Tax=Eumeta variegata TaxID=151549 RepID=A0A4C1URC3_EUMVA|nr:hypothetical protein EVAR_19802_1 [Eumeta japonica]
MESFHGGGGRRGAKPAKSVILSISTYGPSARRRDWKFLRSRNLTAYPEDGGPPVGLSDFTGKMKIGGDAAAPETTPTWLLVQSWRSIRYGKKKKTKLLRNPSRGVRQGCVASLWLFNPFVDSCLYDLKECEYRLRMDELSVKYFLYVDDQVILAPSAAGFRR